MRNAAISEAQAEIKASKGPEPAFDEKAEIEDLSATRGWKTEEEAEQVEDEMEDWIFPDSQ